MGSYYQTMYQYFLLIGLGLCLAAPAADERPYGPSPPAPVYKEPEYKPQPYEYKYGVADDYSKSAFDKVETQDEYGKVVGSYKVNLPDGRVQVVSYVADENGVVYDVQYQGEPSYPPPPQEATDPTRDPEPTRAPSLEVTAPRHLPRPPFMFPRAERERERESSGVIFCN